jgi:very-short-patch-repair endonuclease
MKDFEKGRLSMYRNASPYIIGRSRTLRKNETEAEKVFWNWVKGRQMHGYKFRRQHTLAFYVADFYCHSLQLVVEIDGEIHNHEDNRKSDIERQKAIESMGIRVIRFTNQEVLCQPEVVIEKLEQVIHEIRSTPGLRPLKK